MPPASSSVSQDIKRLAYSIYLPTLLNATARGGTLVLLPLYALQTEGGAWVAAAVVGLQAAGTMIIDVPSGQLTAKAGDKAVMLVGLAIFALTAFVAAFSSSALALAMVAVGFGLGGGAWVMGRLSHLTENVHLSRRGRVISVLAGIQRAGMMIGPVSVGIAAEYIGYGLTFGALGLLSTTSFILVSVFTKRTRLRTVTHVSVGTWQILNKHAPIFTRCGGIIICLMFLRSARQLIIPLWGTEIGLSPSEIGLIFSLSSAIDLLMFYPAGLILDHAGRKVALIPTMVILSIALLLVPWTSTFGQFLSVSLLSGLGNGFGTGILMTLGGDFAPRYGRSQFLGIWRLIGDSGGTAGPFVLGALIQPFTMLVACGFAGVLGIAGAIAAYKLLPETQQREK